MDDAFLSALQHSIKEEIVESYFHQRLVVEKEIAEVESDRASLAEKTREVKKALADLAELLLELRFVDMFWELAGINLPKVKPRPVRSDSPWSWPVKSLSWRGQYKKLIQRAALRLHAACRAHWKAFKNLTALVEEVNQDIDHFHGNFDFLMLHSVLSQLDPETVRKKYFLGSALEGKTCLDMDAALRFCKLQGPECLVLPPLPTADHLARAASNVAKQILKTRPQEVRVRLKGCF